MVLPGQWSGIEAAKGCQRILFNLISNCLLFIKKSILCMTYVTKNPFLPDFKKPIPEITEQIIANAKISTPSY